MTPAATQSAGSPLVASIGVGVLAAVTLARGVAPFTEPDVWWHLREGTYILASHRVTGPDPWALFATRPYTATQWLPEAVAAWVYAHTAMNGVLALRAVVILSTVLVVYATCRRLAGRLASSLAALVFLIASSASLNPRPQLLSFLFFALTTLACIMMLEDQRPRWWLIPIFWAWASCHGLWMFGLALIVLSVVSIVLVSKGGLTPRQIGVWSLLPLGCGAAVALTPLGTRVLSAPFTVANNASWIADEWQATPFNNGYSYTALAALALTAIVWVRGEERPPMWHPMFLAVAAVLSVSMWRLLPLGMVVCAPLLASALQSLLGSVSERRQHRAMPLWKRAASVVALVCCVVVAAALVPTPSRYPGPLPSIDRTLDAAPAGSVVMNDFGVSGWLLWRHESLHPVADLRVEIYPGTFLHSYTDALAARPGWLAFVTNVNARYALLDRDSPLASALEDRVGWHAISRDAHFVLLERGSS